MRAMICAVVAVCFSVFAAAAHADPMYTFTLSQTVGTTGNGSGNFTINVLPSGSQTTYYASNTPPADALEGLSFMIGGSTFTLANVTGSLSGEYVQFDGTTLDAVNYAGNEDTSTVILSLSSSGLTYSYFDSADGAYSDGTITNVTLAPAATPEPSSLALLGTGLLGACLMLRYRRRHNQV